MQRRASGRCAGILRKGRIMRAVAIAVMISMCHAPLALAGDTLREAAVRAADRMVAAEAAASARASKTSVTATTAAVTRRADRRRPANSQQLPRGLEESTGMGTGMKVLLGVGIAAALGGIMMSIDSKVEDNTPSTRGERTNQPF
jgi:hypothetical protein